MRVETISTAEDLRSLMGPWQELSRGHSFFQSWTWNWNWWLTFGGRRHLRTLAVYQDRRLVGIAPLWQSGVYLGIPVRTLRLIGTGPSDYGGFILDPSVSEAVVAEIQRHLAGCSDWDLVDLSEIPETCPTFAHLESDDAALQGESHEQDVTLVMPLLSSWPEVEAGLSKKFRWNLNYAKRRLGREFEVSTRSLEEPAQVEAGMEAFFDLHQKRWRKKKMPGALYSPRFRDFHKRVAGGGSEGDSVGGGRDGCRLYFLDLDGKPVAALYGFLFSNCFYYYLGGFNPEYTKYSVGTVLAAHAIEQALAQGATAFDFLRGEEDYKLKWQAGRQRNYRILLRRPGKGEVVRKILVQENRLRKKAKERLRKV